jgi:transposase
VRIYGFFSLRETLALSANAHEIQAFSDVQIYYLMSDHPEKGGLGYPPWFRERALRFLDGAAGETKDERVQATAETFSVSASSIYAWAARKRDEGTVETKAHAGGVPRSLSGVGDVLLLLYMGTRCSVIVFTRIGLRLVAYPNVTKAKYAYWVGGALGQPVSEEMIGDALNRMRVTRKHIHKTAVEQDPLRFALFLHCGRQETLAMLCLLQKCAVRDLRSALGIQRRVVASARGRRRVIRAAVRC